MMDRLRRPNDTLAPHDCHRKRQALEHHQNLLKNITNLATRLETSNVQQIELAYALNQAKNDIFGLDKYFRDILEPFYYNERRAKDSTIATRVLGVPELLDHILRYVDFMDIIRMIQTCRRISNNIETSSELQSRLSISCLRIPSPHNIPDYGEKTRLSLPGFRCSTYYSTKASISTLGNGNDIPTIGTRWKRTFICDPPITCMKGYVQSPRSKVSRENSFKVRRIRSETGITIGHLLETAKEMLEEDSSSALREAQRPRSRSNKRSVSFSDAILDYWLSTRPGDWVILVGPLHCS